MSARWPIAPPGGIPSTCGNSCAPWNAPEGRADRGSRSTTWSVSAASTAVALQLRARLQSLDPAALRLAEALAILGDGCDLRHAAAVAGIAMDQATYLATELVRLEILGDDRPPRFIHPIVQHAVTQMLSAAEQDAAHRAAARVLHAERAPPGRSPRT